MGKNLPVWSLQSATSQFASFTHDYIACWNSWGGSSVTIPFKALSLPLDCLMNPACKICFTFHTEIATVMVAMLLLLETKHVKDKQAFQNTRGHRWLVLVGLCPWPLAHVHICLSFTLPVSAVGSQGGHSKQDFWVNWLSLGVAPCLENGRSLKEAIFGFGTMFLYGLVSSPLL